MDSRAISLTDWNKPLLMPVTTTNLASRNAGVARDGSNPGSATKTATFGTSGTTVNNSASSNFRYVVGRYAYVRGD